MTKSTDDTITISCYYNPCNWKSRLANYHKFRAKLPSHIPHKTIELSICGSPYQLPDSCMRVSSNSWFWYKERLLNILAKDLIRQGYKKIIWCDADISFESNPYWYEQTAEKLDHFKVVQPFSYCSHPHGPKCWQNRVGTICGYKTFPNDLVDASEIYHPGFACGLQSCVWDLSLYDYAIKGAGDTIFFKTILTKDHAELQKRMSHKIGHVIDPRSYIIWRDKIHNLIDPVKDCDFVEGRASHFWAGTIPNRGYNKRYAMSETIPRIKLGIDIHDDGQMFEWCSPLGRECEAKFKDYLFSRSEDDPEPEILPD